MEFERRSQEQGRLIRTVQIRDFKGFGLHMIKQRKAAGMLRTILSSVLASYPESLEAAFMVNTPASFTVAWNMFSPLFNARTRARIHMLGSDYQTQLLGYVEMDTIRQLVQLGGDEGPVGEGGRGSITVAAGKRCEQSVVVAPEQKVKWHFELQSHDLNFHVSFVQSTSADASEPTKLLAKTKFSSGSHSGECVAPDAGVMIFTFDNHFSWARSKSLHFEIQ
mmetsp:Transcript_30532/g.71726  ORF Transcript_30532/g.71726 Transcript_30532/m.71726 type:complete len:222 (+) Transcript_30532:248-913(+)